jgi:hypothetical protein
MATDKKIYCDFKQCLIGEWHFKTVEDSIVHDFVLDKEQLIILGIYCNEKALIGKYSLDQTNFPNSWSHSETAYFNEVGLMKAFKHKLSAGKHTIRMKCKINEEAPSAWTADVKIYLYKLSGSENKKVSCLPDKVIKYPASKNCKSSTAEKDLSGYNKGIGEDFRSIGRFGFTKGDGILDCAMTTLGSINRMHLFGHPNYKKTTRWQYSILPRDIDVENRFHGSFPPAQVGIENDEIDISYISVKWGTVFSRKGSKNVRFSCRYSLASAGIMVETDDNRLSLNELEYAGNYTRVMLPLEKGLTIRNISLMDTAYDRNIDGELKENWFLFFGADAFPDIPIQLVMQKRPDKINLHRYNEVLSGADVITSETFGIGFMVSPFGIEAFKADETLSKEFEKDAYVRCHFWSRAVLEYPVNAEEFYKLDEENEKVEIVQKFKYQTIKDEWKTQPLKTAPVPPVLSMLDETKIVDFKKRIIDFKFPTKYGYLKGTTGSEFSSYIIPYMPRTRKFPLKEVNDKNISMLLSDGLEDYFAFHRRFGIDQQAYPYAGSSMEPYAWSSPMFNFMDEKHRAELVAKLSERLAVACDPDHQYKYPITNFTAMMREMPGKERVLEIYADPKMRYINLYNSYKRKDPLSEIEFQICYLNVQLFFNEQIKQGTREEVAALKTPLIENDWGVGLMFYYIWLSAIISGDFRPVRENWKTLSERFDYFEKLHDWACMGSAYTENGTSWVEGANYGAFTSFVNLAEAIGENESYSKGVYLSAKQLALRFAIFRSSQTYFYRFFNHKPWYTTKFFHSEADSQSAFQNVPDLWKDKYRYDGIYNMITEGIFPEIFSALNKFLPDEFTYVRNLAWKAHSIACTDPYNWGRVQESCSCLLAAALNDDYQEERLLQEIDEAETHNGLIKEWRGIHIFSRFLPKHYFKCQLLAWLENRKHLAWLENWTNTEIIRAEYDRKQQKAIIEFKLTDTNGLIRLGVRNKPAFVLFDGKKIKYKTTKNGKLEVYLLSSGTLEILFK